MTHIQTAKLLRAFVLATGMICGLVASLILYLAWYVLSRILTIEQAVLIAVVFLVLFGLYRAKCWLGDVYDNCTTVIDQEAKS